MPARRLVALFVALCVALCAPAVSAQSHSRAQIEVLAQYYAQYYGIPLELVRRVINRESTFNPSARNGPYYGLMQILPETARTMGFRGAPADLLNAETNLIYAVKYLRGAYLVARGDQDRAVQHYASGYYYDARDMGLLEETGLRPGPNSPVAPAPPTRTSSAAPAPAPQPLPEFAPATVASAAEPSAPVSVPLAYAPPERPDNLAPPSDALGAIATQAGAPGTAQDPIDPLAAALQARGFEPLDIPAPAPADADGAGLFRGTFALLGVAAAEPSARPAGR